jgi:hypothetical protein
VEAVFLSLFLCYVKMGCGGSFLGNRLLVFKVPAKLAYSCGDRCRICVQNRHTIELHFC